MEMLLMGICISLFGLAIAAAAFGAATRPEAAPAPAKLEAVKSKAPARFFAESIPSFAGAKPGMRSLPIEALLLQIETHVRLEQAAAESFIDYPSAALLHSKTASPLMN